MLTPNCRTSYNCFTNKVSVGHVYCTWRIISDYVDGSGTALWDSCMIIIHCFTCLKNSVQKQSAMYCSSNSLLHDDSRRYPDCKCNRDPKYSPYRIEILNRSKTASGGMYCFNLHTVPCDVENACCTTQMYKISLPIREFLLSQMGW